MQAGINLGNVVASADGRFDYSLMGETVVEALRLQDTAVPGSANLGLQAMERLDGRLDLNATLEGTRDHPVYRIRSLTEVREVSRFRSLAKRTHVGRVTELSRMDEEWRRAGDQHATTVVSVVGEAGIGKSSLIAEFLRRRDPQKLLWGQARAYPPEVGGLFSSMLRDWSGVEEHEKDEAPRRLEEKLQQPAAASLGEHVAFLQALLGYRQALPDYLDPQSYQSGLVAAVRAFVEFVAGEDTTDEPLVLVLEDAHWMDSMSAAVLSALVRSLETNAGVLFLVTSRADDKILPPCEGASHHLRLGLESLSAVEVEEWVHRTMVGAYVPDEVVRAIVQQGEGPPLFLEEMVRHLRERKLLYNEGGTWKLARPQEEWGTPQSLNRLILSRVGELSRETRQVLSQASVVGHEFTPALLAPADENNAAELKDHLEKLVEGRFVVEGGDGSYVFRHALIRQAVYDALLADDRAWLHRRVCELLEEKDPTTVENQPEVLAHHYTEAGQRRQAIRFWQLAGQRAVQSSANEEAIAHFNRALELLQTQPQGRQRTELEVALRISLGAPLIATRGYAADEIAEVFQKVRTLCDQVDDNAQLFRALWGLGAFYLIRAQLHTARELEEQGAATAQNENNEDYLLEARSWLGTIAFYLDDMPVARKNLESALSLYDVQRHRGHAFRYGLDPAVLSLVHLTWLLWLQGNPEQALDRSKEALRVAREVGHPLSLAHALNFSAVLHFFRGEATETQAAAEKEIAISHEFGFPHYLAYARIMRGWALAAQGQLTEGIAAIEEGLDGRAATGAELAKPLFLSLLAWAYGEQGLVTEGLQKVDLALEAAARTGERWWEPELHRARGELLRRGGQATQAEAEFRLAVRLSAERGARALELRAAMSLHRLGSELGAEWSDRSQQNLSSLIDGFTEGRKSGDLVEATRLLEAAD